MPQKMLTNTQRKERQLIQFSIAMGTVYTIAGITWGILIQSGIILFDAIYSGVSILLSMLTMYALLVINKDNSFDANQCHNSSFHMGRTAVEPLVNMVKSIVIISICLYGFVSAVLVLHQGGAENNNASSGIYYGITTALICVGSWGYLKFLGQQHNDLIQAECEQWMVDAVFSLLVVVSFTISYLFNQTESLQHLAGYVDPMTVIVATLYLIKVPINRLIKSTKELLVMAPDETIQQQIKQVLQPFLAQYDFDNQITRATKTGRQLYVDVTFIIDKPERSFRIEQLDKIRTEIESQLKLINDDLWLTVSFTNDRYWA